MKDVELFRDAGERLRYHIVEREVAKLRAEPFRMRTRVSRLSDRVEPAVRDDLDRRLREIERFVAAGPVPDS